MWKNIKEYQRMSENVRECQSPTSWPMKRAMFSWVSRSHSLIDRSADVVAIILSMRKPYNYLLVIWTYRTGENIVIMSVNNGFWLNGVSTHWRKQTRHTRSTATCRQFPFYYRQSTRDEEALKELSLQNCHQEKLSWHEEEYYHQDTTR